MERDECDPGDASTEAAHHETGSTKGFPGEVEDTGIEGQAPGD